jgi:4-amino-4-deoxy-L-arabinose transferase-like glycosyltransferase
MVAQFAVAPLLDGSKGAGRRYDMFLAALIAAGALVFKLAGAWPNALPSVGQLAILLVAIHVLTFAKQNFEVRGSRDFIRKRALELALLVVCAVAFAVRLPGFASDLGHTPLDIDEERIAANVRHFFVTGEVRHQHIEHYPGVMFWFFVATSLLSFIHALTNGVVEAADDLPVHAFAEAARLANIFVAAAAVGITGLIGGRVSGKVAAVAGALLVAIVPLSVETTVLVRNDAGMVLAVLAATYAALAYYDTGKVSWVAASGAFAGVAAGIKYSAVFTIAPVLIAALSVSTLPTRMRAALAGLLSFALALGTSHHFIWADFPNFLHQITAQYLFTGPGHRWSTDEPAWFYVMTLVAGLGWPLLLLTTAFTVYALATHQPKLWIFVSFPLTYMWFMTRRDLQVARWVFPLIPFVAVAGSAALVTGLTRLDELRQSMSKPHTRTPMAALTIAAMLAVFWPPLWAGSLSLSRRVTQPTHQLTEAWIREHAAPGTVVLLERAWLDLSQAKVVTRRVPDLKTVLDGGIDRLGGCDWIVVPEPVFGHPALRQFGLRQRFYADRTFGGNLGLDFEVYELPDVGTASTCGTEATR